MVPSNSREISSPGMAAWASAPSLICLAARRVSPGAILIETDQHGRDPLQPVGNRTVLVVMSMLVLVGPCRRFGVFGVLFGFGRRFEVACLAVEALDIDEQRPVVGRAGRLQDADDGEGLVFVPLWPATSWVGRKVSCLPRLSPSATALRPVFRATVAPMTASMKFSALKFRPAANW